MAGLDSLVDRLPHSLLGYAFFVATLGIGYYYNLTFVQLGLIDLGTRLVGMSRTQVSVAMGALALLTVVVAVAAGVVIDRRGWGGDLRTKLRLLLAVLVVQLLLTAVAPAVGSVVAFGAWVAVCAVALGVGMPVTFSLMADLVPVRHRGYVAAVTTAVAYFAANVYPLDWQIEGFSRTMVAVMLPAVAVLAVVVSGRLTVVDRLLDVLDDQPFGVGRFCRTGPVRTRSAAFLVPVVLMFGAFFVDSLGFLRIVETPVLVLSAWQSPDFSIHLFIAVVHVVGAVVAGVLYTAFPRRWLFLWVFALFSLTHLLYTFDLRLAAWLPTVSDGPSLVEPAFYSLTVSFYTVLNFALWPDLSTPETVGRHTAIGVGLAGWLATFLSTAIALYLRSAEVALLSHLNLVNALALLLFAGLLAFLYGRGMYRAWRAGGEAQ